MLDFDTNALQLKFINSISPNVDFEGVLAFSVSDDGYTVSDGVTAVSLDAELENLLSAFIRVRSGNNQSGAQFFGRIGFATMSVDFTGTITDPGLGTISGSDSESDTDLAFGVGVAIGTSDSGTFTVEYSKLPDIDVDILGADIETSALSIGYMMSY